MSGIREAVVRWLGANPDYALVLGYGAPVQMVYLGGKNAWATPFVASNGLEDFQPSDIANELSAMSLEGKLSTRSIDDRGCTLEVRYTLSKPALVPAG